MVRGRGPNNSSFLSWLLPAVSITGAAVYFCRLAGKQAAAVSEKPAGSESTVVNNNAGMDAVQYAEERSAKTIAVLRSSYDDLHERAYKLATALVAGGGAASIYVLGKMSTHPALPVSWAPIAALALSWFITAAVLIWNGATSRALSPGNGPATLLNYYDARLSVTRDPVEALETTRRVELGLEQARISAYEKGCIARAEAIDAAYKTAAWTTPVVPAVTFLICWRCL